MTRLTHFGGRALLLNHFFGTTKTVQVARQRLLSGAKRVARAADFEAVTTRREQDCCVPSWRGWFETGKKFDIQPGGHDLKRARSPCLS
jgi:hypothetical protein